MQIFGQSKLSKFKKLRELRQQPRQILLDELNQRSMTTRRLIAKPSL